MQTRRFGRTELAMPVLSCGGMRYQHKWEDCPESEIPVDCQANLEACIHRALELGITHIETARGYGTSEMQLGRILPTLPRDRMIVQTKVTPFATPQEFTSTFDKSMRYLKLDHVDLLSFHGVNNAELLNQVIRPGGCLGAAREIQRSGRARFIGFSTHAPCHIIQQTIATGEFDYVNLHWYFVNLLNTPALEDARARDMGVFIISPSDKGGMLYSPPELMTRLCDPLTPLQFNDLFCLTRPEVHTLSIGASQPSDFDEHVAAAAKLAEAQDLIPPITQRLNDQLQAVHGTEWIAQWHTAVPQYTEAPNEVNILEILRLYTYAAGLDLTEWGRMRYNLLGTANHWFPGSKVTGATPEQLRHALADSPLADEKLSALLAAHELLDGEARQRLSSS